MTKTVLIFKLLLIICFFQLFVSCSIFVINTNNNNTFYIDPYNINDNYQDGTTDHPFDSWDKIGNNNLWGKGSTFLQKRCTIYKKPLFLIGLANGSSDNPILIGAYGKGARPKIIANGLYAISIRDCSNWVIQDFDLGGASSQILQIYAQNDNVENIKIINCHINGASLEKKSGRHCVHVRNRKGKNDRYHITNIEISYCLIENAGGIDLNCDGINLSGIKSNAFIHHNIIRNNSGNGIDVGGGSNHIIEYNKLLNNAGSKAHESLYPLINVTIRNNLLIQNKSLYSSSFGLSLQDSFNGKLYNNTVYLNSRGNGALILSSPVNPEAFSNNIIINNIFFGSEKGKATIRIQPELTKRIENYGNIMDNNIISNNDKEYYIIIHNKTDKKNDVRIKNNNKEYWEKKHPDDILVNSCFTDPENNDFTISSNSKAFGMKPKINLIDYDNIHQIGANIDEINKINFGIDSQ